MITDLISQATLDISKLVDAGVLGIILWWFMIRLEKKLISIDDLIKVHLIDISTRPLNDVTRQQVDEMISRVESRSRPGFKVLPRDNP